MSIDRLQPFWFRVCNFTALALALTLTACAPNTYVPELATRPYPHELHTTNTVDIQVFREDTKLTLVNSTATGYRDFDLWINQRYVHHVEALPAGATVSLSLWDFVDRWGSRINAGGFFRTYEPTPVRLVEIQLDDQTPMIGLIAIRTDEIERRDAANR